MAVGYVSDRRSDPDEWVMARRRRNPDHRAMNRFGLALAVLLLVVACGGSASTTTDVWSRDQAIATFEGLGVTGSESPLADGTPRWLGRGANSSLAEVIGASGAVRSVSLTTIVNSAGGKLTGTVLGTFLPGSAGWVTDQITGNRGVDVDTSKDFPGGSAHVQTLNATDGTIVVITVTRT